MALLRGLVHSLGGHRWQQRNRPAPQRELPLGLRPRGSCILDAQPCGPAVLAPVLFAETSLGSERLCPGTMDSSWSFAGVGLAEREQALRPGRSLVSTQEVGDLGSRS